MHVLPTFELIQEWAEQFCQAIERGSNLTEFTHGTFGATANDHCYTCAFGAAHVGRIFDEQEHTTKPTQLLRLALMASHSDSYHNEAYQVGVKYEALLHLSKEAEAIVGNRKYIIRSVAERESLYHNYGQYVRLVDLVVRLNDSFFAEQLRASDPDPRTTVIVPLIRQLIKEEALFGMNYF